MAALLLLAVLSGCRPAPPPDGDLIYGISTSPNSLDPLTAPDIVSRWAVELVFDGLVDVNERLEIVPALAQGWQVSADGLTWRFDLRRDVHWRNGAPFTAADVQATYAAILSQDSRSTLPRSDYAAIARIETPDDSTVRFILTQPDASLLSKLTVGIAPACAEVPPCSPAPSGTGPFVLQEWLPGQRLHFTANTDYFAGKPGLKTLTWQVIPDPAALLLQLQNGEIDGALVETPEDVARLTALNTFQAYGVPGGNLQISLQLNHDLFQDRRVRQALALAVDRASLIAGLLAGRGTLSAGDILPGSWAYNPQAADLYPYDPAQARALLAQAGWRPGNDGILVKDGRRFSFTLSTDAGNRLRQEIALTVRQQWRQIGVETEIAFVERNTFVTEQVLKGQFQAALLQSSVRADPDLSRRFHSRSMRSGQNFLSYGNSMLDDLLEQALRIAAPAERAPLYRQAQMILAQDAPQINLFYPTAYYIFRSDVQGIRPSAMSAFWNVQEWRR